MKNKAVFLDRDGTINVEKKYIYKIEEFEFLPDVIYGLRRLQDAGFLLIIITNQSGIGRGYYTEREFKVLNSWMIGQLEKEGIYITDVFYCPHLPNATVKKYRKVCSCRKPALGLYNQAVKQYNIDLGKSFAVGDKIRDCAICARSECKGFLINQNEKIDIINQVINGEYKNVMYCESFAICVNSILS